MNNVFSDYILSFREKNGSTQSDIIKSLSQYDEQFSKLDITTISRWENRKTVPTLAKQLLVTRALGGDVSDILKHYCDSPTISSKQYLKPFMVRTVNPYDLIIPHFKLKVFETLIKESETLNKVMIFHDHFLQMPIDISSYIEKKSVRLKGIFDLNGNLNGHCLYGFCTIKNLKHHFNLSYIDCIDKYITIDDENINHCHLVMNVLSSYGSSPYSRAINIIKILQRINSLPMIKTLVITIHYQEVYDFFIKLQNVKVIQKGKEVMYGGIKLGTKNYSYVRLYIRTEYLFIVREFMTLIVHAEHYLNDLLSEIHIEAT